MHTTYDHWPLANGSPGWGLGFPTILPIKPQPLAIREKKMLLPRLLWYWKVGKVGKEQFVFCLHGQWDANNDGSPAVKVHLREDSCLYHTVRAITQNNQFFLGGEGWFFFFCIINNIFRCSKIVHIQIRRKKIGPGQEWPFQNPASLSILVAKRQCGNYYGKRWRHLGKENKWNRGAYMRGCLMIEVEQVKICF